MQLSEWQLGRVRNAVRAYHLYERSHDGDAFTWKDVSEAIDEYTGVKVPPERLRQFVEGVKQEDGSFKFPVPKGERIKAIHDFVLDPEIGLLTAKEIEERDYDVQAAIRLLEYLDQDFDTERIVPPKAVAGTYQEWRPVPPHWDISELILSSPLENGVVKVNHVQRVYENDRMPARSRSKSGEPQERLKSEARHGGWAILTPEDNFLLFLKEEGVGKNRYFLTLESDLDHARPVPISKLSFLEHDYPLETPADRIVGENDDPTEVLIARNFHIYSRMDGA